MTNPTKLNRRAFVASILAASSGVGLFSRNGASAVAATLPKASGTTGQPSFSQFVDVAHESGLTAPMIYGGAEQDTYIVESVGGGCAFFDYDNDGWMDIFILGGTRLEGPPPGTTNRLYKNNRNGTFADVTEKAGLHDVGWAMGVCVGDYNNDGNEDLFCTYYGQNKLYRNNGDGTFTDVTKAAGLFGDVPRFGTGCSF